MINKFQHIQHMNDTLEELEAMQDRTLDRYDPQSPDKQQREELLKEISKLKEEFQSLIKDFEKLP